MDPKLGNDSVAALKEKIPKMEINYTVLSNTFDAFSVKLQSQSS